MDGNHGIPLDKGELLATLLEAFLYGFSLLMFGGTIWVLLLRRATSKVNYRMLTAACLLLVLSTGHVIIDTIRIVQALILYRDTYPGGPIAFLARVSHWTFVYKNCLYTLQTLIGDGVIIYRCYVVWQSKLVVVLPGLLWCAVAVNGTVIPYTTAHVTSKQDGVFIGSLSQWITSFWATAFTANVVATTLLASRIWYIDQRTKKLLGHRTSRLRPILYVVIDAGLVYSLTILTALICFLEGSNAQYVLLDMAMPIISITFYMVIIRVGLAGSANQSFNMLLVNRRPSGNGCTSSGDQPRMQVNISRLSDKLENSECSSVSPSTLLSREHHRSEATIAGDLGEVA